MSGSNRSGVGSTGGKSGWMKCARSAARGMRELVVEYARALQGTSIAEKDHRHPAPARRLYENDQRASESPETGAPKGSATSTPISASAHPPAVIILRK